ncbi:MAG: Maf family nucleotide pyrophosphatase [Acidiferrobacterales bacterium]
MKLILASTSPYRRLLLERLQLPFEAIAPNIDETPLADETPPQLVERLAITKAQAVARNAKSALVIGSDQVAVHNGGIIGKPRDHDHAVKQLRAASGNTITLYTGLALVNSDTGATQSEVVPYRVTFRTLTDEQIETYLRKEQPYDCTGSVKSEGLGIALLRRFEGEDPNTLIGLPLMRLVSMLEQEGILPLG